MRTITEIKRKLDGRVLRYECEALEVTSQRAILLYRLPRPVDLAGVAIPAGAVSFGLYWPERPYNVYRWVGADGALLACYCNVATDTRIAEDAVDWLDLEADVLITPDGRVRVLDLDEVPADLSPARRRALDDGLARLRRAAAVVAEAEACTRAYRRW